MIKCFPTTKELDDNYDHDEDDSDLEYILECVLMTDDSSTEFEDLKNNYNSQLIQKCNCLKDGCRNPGECLHGGSYEYIAIKKELVLNPESNQPIFECNNLCKCDIKCCGNRLLQYGPRKNLEIFYSPRYQSKGVRTTVDIPLGAFICEYVGELITKSESKRRAEINDRLGQMNYVMCLKEFATNGSSKEPQVTIVDPHRRGNIGRYLNHSCQPNCKIIAVRIDCPIPKIGIFASRNITAFEELCFHYGGEEKTTGGGKPCLCGNQSCAGVMPNTEM